MIRGCAALAVALALVPPALANDADLLRAMDRLPTIESAAREAQSGAPDAVQRLYDRARDTAEDLRAAVPISASCRPLWAAAVATAEGHVRAAEGVDRLSPGAAAKGRRDAAAGARRVVAERPGCRPGPPAVSPEPAQLLSPRSGEAYFGTVRASAPPGAATAELRVDGRTGRQVAVSGGEVSLVSETSGHHDISLAFRDAQGIAVGEAASMNTWTLPVAARVARDGTTADAALSRRLVRLAAGFPGYAGLWVQNLGSGRTASHNADARFPAASTVKLALLVGALSQRGPSPEASRDAYDLRAMAGWSSNLATNRILARMGGSALAQRVMTRLGATRSTFTGGYIVGTQLQPALPGGGLTAEPPATSSRVTTARDMARLLFALHAAASGRVDALAATGLTLHQARVGLAMLLNSEQRGDNRSLVAGGVPPGTPIAQKNGWLRRARHGAAILYTPSGPRIVVVLTYAGGGVTLEKAARLGKAAAETIR